MTHSTRRTAVVTIAAICAIAQAPAQHVDLSGIWNSATATPLERPAQLKDKPFFTPQEAAEWEREAGARNAESQNESRSQNVGTYNTAWREFGLKVVKTLRTSIVTDPPDGRIPTLTPTAAAEKRRRTDLLRHPNSSKDLGLQDQCVSFTTAVPPMIPYSYNSNYLFIQTAHELIIQVEMIHDSRIIRLDGRAHLPAHVRLWLGDSIGHWEGATLVVDTTNFKDGPGYFGDAGGMFGTDRNLHVVERFSVLDAATLLYQFEVDDPSAYTQPWKGEVTMARSTGPIYEYACHEGNYALPNLLNAFRASESEPTPKR